MAVFLPEDGTGIAGATSYATLAQAQAFHDANGTRSDWEKLELAEAEAGMLIQASRKLDQSYRWAGVILTDTQGLGLPRQDITLEDGRVLDGEAQVAMAADAASYLALRLFGSLQPTAERQVVRESLPDYEVAYATGASGGPTYAELDAMLAGLYSGGGLGGGMRNVRLVRWS